MNVLLIDIQLDPGFRELTVLEKLFSKIGILLNWGSRKIKQNWNNYL